MNVNCVVRFVFFVCIFAVSEFAIAKQDPTQDNKTIVPESKMIEVEIKVVDPDGNPVESADVYCTGLRTKANPASHHGWNHLHHGEPTKHKTNNEGDATVLYPEFVKEKLETARVTWSVDHPDFMTFRGDLMVDDDSPTIQLQRGCRIALNAVHSETGEKLTSDLNVVMGLTESLSQWKVTDRGMLVSPVSSPKRSVFRVVHLVKNKPSAFSDLIVVEPEGKSRVLLKDVKIFPGVRVEGRIDDAIPRPVKSGVVEASFVNNPNENQEGRDSWMGRWQWNDTVNISEDGTFEFESVPRDGTIQLFARCDGWSNSRPDKAEVLNQFPQFERKYNLGWRLPHFEKLSGDKTTLTVPMTKNSEVRVTVTGPDKEPLANAMLMVFPSQLLFDGGGGMYGSDLSTRKSLLAPNQDASKRVRVTSPLRTKTDKQGKATLLVPPTNAAQVLVNAKGFQMGIDRGSRIRRIKIEAGKPKEVSVRMAAMDSKKLGDKQDVD